MKEMIMILLQWLLMIIIISNKWPIMTDSNVKKY